MYRWHSLSPSQRLTILKWRQSAGFPAHSPPHFDLGKGHYLITAACYKHIPIIGESDSRLSAFTQELLLALQPHVLNLRAWVVSRITTISS